ncbi:hypothetical protein CRYUN_Cryun39dG0026800 [Craigia yunnanensis]
MQAKLLWISCRQDLNDLKEAFEDPKLHLLEETRSTTNDINRKGHSLAKENIQKLINVLHPQLKQALSDCIRKNNLLFRVSGEDSGLKNWYTRYFESLFRWRDVPTRTLATQSTAVAPALNLGPSPAPAPSPASESPDFSPDPLQSPASSPLPLPIPSHQAAPPINDLLDNLSPANRDSENKGTDNGKTIIVACVVTAVVTSVVVALFFFLCCRQDSGAKQNDDRPLLSLSLNEFSGGIYLPTHFCCLEAFDKFLIKTFFFPGSSHAYAFGLNKEEKLGHQTFGNESSLHKKASTNGNVYIESNALQISLDGKSSFGAVARSSELSDVKGIDGKTTLLHFVVQEVIRTEGLRAARVARKSKSFNSIKSDDLLEDVSPDTEEHYRSLGLQVVSRLSSELENVKKAAALDAENLTGTVAKLGHALLKACDFLNSEMKSTEEESGFHETLKCFVQNAEADVMSLLEEE